MSSPVSAKRARKTPSAPRLASTEVELSGLSATRCTPCENSIERVSFLSSPIAEPVLHGTTHGGED